MRRGGEKFVAPFLLSKTGSRVNNRNMRYFKKLDPRVKVMLSTGDQVQFEAVTWDVGVYPPEGRGISDWMGNELGTAIVQGRGGMEEITRDEYVALLDKKKTNPSGLDRPQREEWKMQHRIEGAITTSVVRTPTDQPSTPPPVAVVASNPGAPVAPAATARPTASKGVKIPQPPKPNPS